MRARGRADRQHVSDRTGHAWQTEDRQSRTRSSSWSWPAPARASCCAAARRAIDVGDARSTCAQASPQQRRSRRQGRAVHAKIGDAARRSTGRDCSTMALMLIALGVTGGIGAYKAVEVARGLQKRGHEVVADHDAIGAAGSSARSPSRRSPGAASSPISARRARTPTSSTSRSPPTSTCCWSRRRPPTSSASSPTASPTIS